jgi:hypothetical protein
MANTGGEVDTDPEFVPFRHAGPLWPLYYSSACYQCIVFMRIKCGVQGRVFCFV